MPHAGIAVLDPYAVFERAGLKPGMRVADLGCGRTGHFVFPASRQVGEQGIVYAVDVMKDILENIKSRARSEGYHNVQTVWSNIELPGKTAIPDASLDGCFFVGVLCHLGDRAAAMAEAARLLKPDGFLAIVEWAKNLGSIGPTPQALLTPQVLRASLPQHGGLTVSEEFPVGDYHFCLIVRKSGL